MPTHRLRLIRVECSAGSYPRFAPLPAAAGMENCCAVGSEAVRFDCVEDGYITAPASPLGGTPHHRHQHPQTDLTSTATLHTITPSVSETKSTMLPSVIVLTIALAASTANAACVPWKDGGTLQVCKSAGKRNCLGASSDSTCINLIGGPFISGFSGGGYTCRIYSGSGCSGRYASVDRDGWSRFPFTARSFRCPCV